MRTCTEMSSCIDHGRSTSEQPEFHPSYLSAVKEKRKVFLIEIILKISYQFEQCGTDRQSFISNLPEQVGTAHQRAQIALMRQQTLHQFAKTHALLFIMFQSVLIDGDCRRAVLSISFCFWGHQMLRTMLPLSPPCRTIPFSVSSILYKADRRPTR